MEPAVCHVHGRAGLTHVCMHIRAALDVKGSIPVWTSYTLAHPPDYIVVRLCAQCAEQRKLPAGGRLLAADEIALDQLDTYPTCEACFVELTSEP